MPAYSLHAHSLEQEVERMQETGHSEMLKYMVELENFSPGLFLFLITHI
jgi:hypothetical protein